ncbi:MAG: GGDEF domain-containing protein [Acholeplasmataceae bacterium]|jgi:diguanylate cyclase (GGDEF)-like protein|nr:GGDEF domain-containing protein [Acholeplasmataceae bacterium]
MFNADILRLVVSHVFAVYFFLLLIPLKDPKKRNTIIIILSSLLLILINAFIITYLGLSFYIRFYFLTLSIPHILLFYFLSNYKFSKVVFALLTVQVFGNVAIINGLLASYIFYGENNGLIDTLARVLTYAFFLPILIKYIRPIYIKMAEILTKGWWILNFALLLSYALAYFVLFVPNPIFERPDYFIHAYLGLFLSLVIYSIMFSLFNEIKLKKDTEHDKEILSMKMNTLVKESAEMTTIALNDALTGVKNRYSLFRQIDYYIENKQTFLVIFMDLDNLKEINDNYDHSIGDIYLKDFAKVLKEVIDNQGEVYRFAGDEFIGLLTKGIDDFNKDDFKSDVRRKMIGEIPYGDMSLGYAIYPLDGDSADELINLADQAMYAEKKLKKNRR